MGETELLIPAGSLEVLKVAVNYGADAVYIGGEAFGLRAKAHNFTIDDMKEGVSYCHERNVKLYVTIYLPIMMIWRVYAVILKASCW